MGLRRHEREVLFELLSPLIRSDAEDGVRKLLTLVRERTPKRFRFDPVRDIQVLCPMNRGGLGARSISSFRET